MASHYHENDSLITTVLLQLAGEQDKSLKQIKDLLLIKQDQDTNNRFWEVLDILYPGHQYQYFGCCGKCGSFELLETPPH